MRLVDVEGVGGLSEEGVAGDGWREGGGGGVRVLLGGGVGWWCLWDRLLLVGG